MNKLVRAITVLLFVSASANAQQDIALTHFMYNKMAVNPGATGMEDGLCGNLIYRNQWDKVNGAPNSAIFNAEMNLSRYISGGAGINITHDAIAFNRQNNILLNYSHHLIIGDGVLGIGLGLGIVTFGLNPTWVPPSTLNDPSLPAGSSALSIDANFGAYYRARNWYAGLSSTHLPAPKLSQGNIIGTGNVTYNAARHYYFSGGYTFRAIGDGEIDAQALIQTDLIKLSAQVNARYIYKGFVYGGLGFRNSDALSVLLGYKVIDKGNPDGSRIFGWAGYSYDLTIGKISNISRGTHELAVKACYLFPPPQIQKSKHPRWL